MSVYAAAALWGIHCLQTFIYFNTYSNDPCIVKVLVAWTWIADTVHQGLLLSYEYSILITHFGDLEPRFQVNTEVILQGLFTICISVPIQLFFLNRIWRLSGKKNIIPLFLVACILLEIVSGVVYFQWALHKDVTTTTILVGTKRAVGVTYLVTAASIDVIIAISMVYLLREAKLDTSLTITKRLLTHLIVYSVNSGLWTALIAVFCVMTMIAYPNTFVYIGLYMSISPIYCNTLLANLNIRQHIRGLRPDVIFLSVLPPNPTIDFQQVGV
ncbi:hypothetical protein C8J57DRAFT_1302113 [Mycena rebaudengoi]|nr:hypothetical protein C8J57DRAFT_1302113 [Mycena rebaudengoi]